MSDDIAEYVELAEIISNALVSHGQHYAGLTAAAAILERFLVVPRDQVTTEYGVLYSSGENHRAIDRDNAATIVRSDRKHPGVVRDYDPKLASRLVLPWTVIPLPEDDSR